MQRLPMHLSPRCKARSKRTGKPCGSPAVIGYEVCRMHAAGGGPPEGNRNASKHGAFGAEVLRAREFIETIARIASGCRISS